MAIVEKLEISIISSILPRYSPTYFRYTTYIFIALYNGFEVNNKAYP